MKKGYSNIRHRVTQCDTFGRFARQLAKEWASLVSEGGAGNQASGSKQVMKPAFARRAAEMYNLGPAKTRRLNSDIAHEVVFANRAYCVLCSFTITHKYHGKEHSKKFGWLPMVCHMQRAYLRGLLGYMAHRACTEEEKGYERTEANIRGTFY